MHIRYNLKQRTLQLLTWPWNKLQKFGKTLSAYLYFILWELCVWMTAGLSSLTWPETDWLDCGAEWGCTPVAHWGISVHRINQPSPQGEIACMATWSTRQCITTNHTITWLQHHHPESLSVEPSWSHQGGGQHWLLWHFCCILCCHIDWNTDKLWLDNILIAKNNNVT